MRLALRSGGLFHSRRRIVRQMAERSLKPWTADGWHDFGYDANVLATQAPQADRVRTGSPTRPISRLAKDGLISPPPWICTAGISSAGACRRATTPSWPSRHWRRPGPGTGGRISFATATGGPPTPATASARACAASRQPQQERQRQLLRQRDDGIVLRNPQGRMRTGPRIPRHRPGPPEPLLLYRGLLQYQVNTHLHWHERAHCRCSGTLAAPRTPRLPPIYPHM